MIQYRDWYIWTQGQVVARQFDHMTRSLEVVGELPEGWEWTVIVRVGEYMDYLPLTRTQTGAAITLTAQQLALPGMYSIQLRGRQGEQVRHTNVLSVYVPASLSGDANWPEIPSAFTQLEQRVLAVGEQAAETAKQAETAATQIAGAAQTIEQAKDEAGRAAVAAGESVTEAAASERAAKAAASLAESYSSHPPIIGENGNWWTWDGTQYADSGKPSQGELTHRQGNTLYANALKGAASGAIVRMDDVSPLEHDVPVKVSGAPDPTTVTVYRCGKNLCPTASITTAKHREGAIWLTPADYPYLLHSGGCTLTLSADVTVYPDDTSERTMFDVAVSYTDGTNTLGRKWVDDPRDGVARHYSVSAKIAPGKTLKMLTLKPLACISATGARNAKAENIQVELGDTATAYEPYSPLVIYHPGEDGACDVTSIAPTMTLLTDNPNAVMDCAYNRDTCKTVEQLQQACQDAFPYADYGMPVVYFEGDTAGISKDNKVNLSYRYGQREGTCTLKWQGSSSLAYPKKNYTVVFDNAFEAKSGWGEQKKYCLKANYIDFSHARNICSARIWANIVKNRPAGYFGKVTIPATPNYGAVDGFPCMVVINGAYQGLYTFNIPKDGWMMGMGSGTREAILCAKGVYTNPSPTRLNATATTLESDFDLEYVSDENDADWVLTSLNNMISACINCDGTDYETLMQYVDISSAIDYMIFLVALKAADCVQKNFILATYDGVKWFFSAYDLDSTWGLYWDGKSFVPAYQTDDSFADTFAKTANGNKLFNIIWNNATLRNELLTRWRRYTTNTGVYGCQHKALMPQYVENVFTNFAKDIPKAVLDEETRLWKGIPSTSVSNVHQILHWYKERIERVNVELGI